MAIFHVFVPFSFLVIFHVFPLFVFIWLTFQQEASSATSNRRMPVWSSIHDTNKTTTVPSPPSSLKTERETAPQCCGMLGLKPQSVDFTMKLYGHRFSKHDMLQNKKESVKYFSGYEVCHVSSSYHRIRRGWIYSPVEVRIIPCQIQGCVYFVHPF